MTLTSPNPPLRVTPSGIVESAARDRRRVSTEAPPAATMASMLHKVREATRGVLRPGDVA